MKILTVIGARPQFIKASILSRCLAIYPEIEEYVLHTGQHYDDNMSSVFFSELGLREADLNLNIQSGSNASMVARMIPAIEDVIKKERPDLVLVYGDTNSTLAAALAAKLCGIKLAHVEAGMRHGDMSIPEELNRVVTDQISDHLFCSTEGAMENLRKEGFDDKAAASYHCGDLMMDAAVQYSELASKRPSLLTEEIRQNFILCTFHRSENVDDKQKLENIFSAIDTIALNIPVVLPLHPRTRKRMDHFGINTMAKLMDPLGYLDMLNLIRDSKLIITDSGGLQKEAYRFKKHTVLLREFTEWTELDENGYLIICDTDQRKILNASKILLERKSSFAENFYGNGDAGLKIAKVLNGLLQNKGLSLHES
jgi:UDP-GlcNAc3NAcA epimerase